MRILVTGAAGFIGSHAVDCLLAQGHHVTGIDNFDTFYSQGEKRGNLAGAFANSRFSLVEGDITDAAVVERAYGEARPEIVLHLAAKAGVRPSFEDPAAYERVNVSGTRTILDIGARHGVVRFVVASSSSVYGNSSRVPFCEDDPPAVAISPYASTKQATEAVCRDHQGSHGGAILCLRFFTVYGPRQRPDLAIRKFCGLMAAGRPIQMYGDGSTERDYTWIDDILEGVTSGIAWTGSHPQAFEVVNLGGNRPASLKRLIALLGDAMGVDPIIEHWPEQQGDVRRTWADLTKAARLLGYAPKTPLEKGIPLFANWYRLLSS